MSEMDDRELVNPYHNGARRRLRERIGGGLLRRRLTQLIIVLVSVTLVGGTVATSCGGPSPGAESRTTTR